MADSDKSLKTSIETDASQAISEQERYNAKLKEMAEATGKASLATKELADAEAYAALKREHSAALDAKNRQAAAAALHERNVNSIETASANQEIEKTVRNVSEAEVKAALVGVEATNKVTKAKGFLKNAIKGLGPEFSGLGHAAKMFFNPVTLAVAGIVSAFVIWRKRVKELKEAMVEFELADAKITGSNKRINALKDEWKAYADMVGEAREKVNGLAAQHDDALKKIESFFDLVKKLGAPEGVADEREQRAKLGEFSSAIYASRVRAEQDLPREIGALSGRIQASRASLNPEKRASEKAALEQQVKEMQAGVDKAAADVAKYSGVSPDDKMGEWTIFDRQEKEKQARATLASATAKLEERRGVLKTYTDVDERIAQDKEKLAKLLKEKVEEETRLAGLRKERDALAEQYGLNKALRILGGERPAFFRQGFERQKSDPLLGEIPGKKIPGLGTVVTASGRSIPVTPGGQGETLTANLLPLIAEAFRRIDEMRAEERTRATAASARLGNQR